MKTALGSARLSSCRLGPFMITPLVTPFGPDAKPPLICVMPVPENAEFPRERRLAGRYGPTAPTSYASINQAVEGGYETEYPPFPSPRFESGLKTGTCLSFEWRLGRQVGLVPKKRDRVRRIEPATP
jgi:hypothetical protein